MKRSVSRAVPTIFRNSTDKGQPTRCSSGQSCQVWLWLLPGWLGLSLAIPIVWLTALREAGQMARRAAGLLLVAGEIERPDPAVPEVRCAEPDRAGRLNPVG